MMQEQTFIIEIDSDNPENNSSYANELKEAILDASTQAKAELKRKNENAQDFGSTIVLILGAPAVVVIAQAIRDWIKLRSKAEVSITKPNGEKIKITDVTGEQAVEILRLSQK